MEPTRVPTPPAASLPEPTPAPPAEKSEPQMGGVLTEEKLKNFFRFWKTRPPERRARRAMEVASLANFWIATHPGDPFSGELKRTLPETLRTETEQALEDGKPGLARLFHNAYRQFRFSPLNPSLAQRVREAGR
jgi:hypothetical protein